MSFVDVNDPVEETEIGGYEEESYEVEDDVESSEEEDQHEESEVLTKEEVNEIVQNRLARDRKKRERELAQQLGVPVEEAKEYIAAGRDVSQASGLTPAQVRQRLAESRAQQSGQYSSQGAVHHGQSAAYPDDVRNEINEIKHLISEERTEKILEKQKNEARKEFGKLYDDFSDDIADMAEERGLTLVEASAIVLRPKLRKHYETQAKAKQQFRKNRRVDSSKEGPVKDTTDYKAALTAKEQSVAQRMGISLEKYYKQKRALNEIE